MTIFHPLYGYGLCYSPHYAPVVDEKAPEHGRLVVCGLCQRTGVLPDAGHELEFLPPGTERAPDGKGFILRFGSS